MTGGDGAPRPGVRGAIVALGTTPGAGLHTAHGGRAEAAAEIVAAHRAELRRDAYRLVRSAGVAEADQVLAAAVVADVQESVLRGAARSGVPLDSRTWAPLVQLEAAAALRAAAAEGVLAATAPGHRLARERAALLVLRQAAADLEPASCIPAAPLRAGGAGTRRERRVVAAGARRTRAARTRTARTARFGTAFTLSTATIVLGAALAPAADLGGFSTHDLPLVRAVQSTLGLSGGGDGTPQVLAGTAISPAPSAVADEVALTRSTRPSTDPDVGTSTAGPAVAPSAGAHDEAARTDGAQAGEATTPSAGARDAAAATTSTGGGGSTGQGGPPSTPAKAPAQKGGAERPAAQGGRTGSAGSDRVPASSAASHSGASAGDARTKSRGGGSASAAARKAVEKAEAKATARAEAAKKAAARAHAKAAAKAEAAEKKAAKAKAKAAAKAKASKKHHDPKGATGSKGSNGTAGNGRGWAPWDDQRWPGSGWNGRSWN